MRFPHADDSGFVSPPRSRRHHASSGLEGLQALSAVVLVRDPGARNQALRLCDRHAIARRQLVPKEPGIKSNTTGLSSIDYRVTDRHLNRPESHTSSWNSRWSCPIPSGAMTRSIARWRSASCRHRAAASRLFRGSGRRLGATAVLAARSSPGLPELVARSDAEFVERAAALSRDLPALAALRRALRSRMLGSRLMDGARFARNMEAGCRAAWERHCAGLEPQRIDLEVD